MQKQEVLANHVPTLNPQCLHKKMLMILGNCEFVLLTRWCPEVLAERLRGSYLTNQKNISAPPPQPLGYAITSNSINHSHSHNPLHQLQQCQIPTSNGGTSYYLGVNDLHTSSQQVNCGIGTVLRK